MYVRESHKCDKSSTRNVINVTSVTESTILAASGITLRNNTFSHLNHLVIQIELVVFHSVNALALEENNHLTITCRILVCLYIQDCEFYKCNLTIMGNGVHHISRLITSSHSIRAFILFFFFSFYLT